MNADGVARDFAVKFSKLNESNQKYILAIQQALMFAQTSAKQPDNPETDTADDEE